MELQKVQNDANVHCFGARSIEPEQAARMVGLFLETDFVGERLTQRVEKLSALDRR
jgi:ribose 5-phosphate isomerase RpiB